MMFDKRLKETCRFITIFCISLLSTAHSLADSEPVRILIDPTTTYQTVEGFGHGNMEQFTPKWYQQYGSSGVESILDTLYTLDNGGLGLNIYRYPMPAADAPGHKHMDRLPDSANKPFEYNDGQFNWEGHEDVLWMGTGAAKRGAKLWASWYGMPYWLSSSGCASGSVDGKSNNLVAGKEKRFIQHVIDVMKHFRNEWGIDFEWVNPINEPEADWWKTGGGQPGSHVSAEQAIILYTELEKALKENELDAKIVAYDAAFTNTTEYLDTLLSSDIQPMIDVLACHQYVTSEEGLRDWADRAQKNHKSLWMSEWGDWTNTRNRQGMQVKQMMNYANKLHEAFEILNANAWLMWEAGFIFDTQESGLEKRKAYWAIAHYSRHVRPGFKRIRSISSDKEVKTTAWIKKDANNTVSKLVLVTVNSDTSSRSQEVDFSGFEHLSLHEVFQTSAEKNYERINTASDGFRVQVTLPEQSVTTIEFGL